MRNLLTKAKIVKAITVIATGMFTLAVRAFLAYMRDKGYITPLVDINTFVM